MQDLVPIEAVMDVTVVQDHLSQLGGAERVLRSIAKISPAAKVLTSVYVPSKTYPEISELSVAPMWFSSIPLFRRNHRFAFPLMAPGFSAKKSTANVTLCCSAGWSHGAQATGGKVVYWYAPARWIYQRSDYVGDVGAVARIIGAVAPLLERWDRRAVATVDRHLAVSTIVARRLSEIYGIEAEVLHPPVTLDAEPRGDAIIDGPYAIVVSRLLDYKNVDLVVEAFSDLPELQLVVVGDGPQAAHLRSIASNNVRFMGSVTDEELATLYAHSSLLVSAAIEDFGLSPLEAGQFGVTSAVLRRGGFLDSVCDGLTGVFFDEANVEDIREAVRKAIQADWDTTAIRRRSQEFGEQRFLDRLTEVLEEESRVNA